MHRDSSGIMLNINPEVFWLLLTIRQDNDWPITASKSCKDGICGHRLEDIEFPFGHHMLQVAGKIPGSDFSTPEACAETYPSIQLIKFLLS
jgi:hypothetical protein